MGYYVKARLEKKVAPQWKVQFISFKKRDTAGSNAKDIRVRRFPAAIIFVGLIWSVGYWL